MARTVKNILNDAFDLASDALEACAECDMGGHFGDESDDELPIKWTELRALRQEADIAFVALVADVMKALEHRGVDLSDFGGKTADEIAAGLSQ